MGADSGPHQRSYSARLAEHQAPGRRKRLAGEGCPSESSLELGGQLREAASQGEGSELLCREQVLPVVGSPAGEAANPHWGQGWDSESRSPEYRDAGQW